MSSPSPLSSLTLVRLLQQWAPAPGEAARQDVAERLADWLSAFDSVKLEGALQAISSYAAARQQRRQPAGAASADGVDAAALEALCRQTQAALSAQIDAQLAMQAKAAQAPATTPAEDGYGPYLQRHAALQRQMEGRVGACRAEVRQMLAKGSPRLRQLAALDGVLAELFTEREQKLLAAVPIYLERRFAYWRDQARGDARPAWLTAFHDDMRQTLLAELQLRLQPVLGLVDAARHEATLTETDLAPEAVPTARRQLDIHRA